MRTRSMRADHLDAHAQGVGCVHTLQAATCAHTVHEHVPVIHHSILFIHLGVRHHLQVSVRSIYALRMLSPGTTCAQQASHRKIIGKEIEAEGHAGTYYIHCTTQAVGAYTQAVLTSVTCLGVCGSPASSRMWRRC